jgi:zinc ribbon protein
MQCPKCGSEARDVASFCPRCHATLRYQCPSCKHEQRHGGICEKCGVNFLKYISAVIAAKKAEADVEHERIEQRSTLMKNLLLTPFTLGIPLLRDLFVGSRKGRNT